MSPRNSTLAGERVDSRWFHLAALLTASQGSKCVSVPHRAEHRAVPAGAPQWPAMLKWPNMTMQEAPQSIMEEFLPKFHLEQCLLWLLGGSLKIFMDNKTIYSLPCGPLFKPSTRGSRTFLALPARMPGEGGESSCLNVVPESTQFSLHSKRQTS